MIVGGEVRGALLEAAMANIVELRAARARYERRSRAETTGVAEVVLFPGVRYDRWSEQTAVPRSARRVRDTLDLID